MSIRRMVSGIPIGAIFFAFAVAGRASAQQPSSQVQQEQPSQQQQPAQPPTEEEPGDVPERPLRGLFGASDGKPLGMALTMSLFGEYSNDMSASGDHHPIGSVVQRNGYFTGMRADLSYVRRSAGATLGLRGEGSGRYYPDLQEYSIPRFRSGLDFLTYANPERTASIRIGQELDYTPYYSLAVDPSLVSPLLDQVGLRADREDHLVGHEAYLSSSSLTYARTFTPRTGITAAGSYRFTYSDDPSFDVRDLSGGIHLTHRFTQYFGVQTGYAYRHGLFPVTSAVRQMTGHDIDLGIEYSRPISKSRHAFLSFSSGSGIVNVGPQRIARVSATGALRFDLPNRWAARIAYNRGVQIVEGFSQPFFSDAVVGELRGFLTPRLEASLEVGGAIGQVGFSESRYHNYQGSARIRYAFSRYMAIDAQGLFSQYHFGQDITLPALMPHMMDRRGGLVSLVLWLPMTR